ncbi:MAG: ADP-ribosylglycohydrolase family protein [Burkholderiaceae bacterium]|nr:ADP-ribosylglycohydrolase family protein [Burkholderiaceae bacterium]
MEIHAFLSTGEAYSGSTDPNSAGNGSLMRLAPIAMYFGGDERQIQEMAALSSLTTHGAPECLDACRLFAVALSRAIQGRPKAEVLDLADLPLTSPKLKQLAMGGIGDSDRAQISGSGYVVESLEAALWCFARHNNFRSTVLEAANLGDDADTTAAIAGQLAGAYYGVDGIPVDWLRRLHLATEIGALADSIWMARR